MTARPAFGDFLTAARDHASVAAAGRQADRRAADVQEVTGSLLHVITVMGRYLQDITAVPGDLRSRASPPLTAWGRARLTARDALTHAAGHLRQHGGGRRAPGVTARSELARRLDAAAVSLTAGRDLLHTHLARDPRGARQFRSEWGLVICSPPAERALLGELASLARQIAVPCTDLALSSRSPDTADARRGLRGACGWLQVLSACVQAAQRTDPVSGTDRDLLLAIPLNAPLPRPVLDGGEPVAALYDAVITSAERARHAAWVTGTQPAWSPHLTADSLRQVAATSTVTSHHCEILLRALAARTADGDTAGLGAGLLRAADAAGRARDGWLHAARALTQVDTDTLRHLPATAGQAGDLALCTGRLAYADAAWTLSSGPGHQPRPPHDLAPQPGDVPLALAAAHHACDAVTSLAYAERERIRTAASAGRLLVPTRSLPGTMDIPRPFAPALRGHIDALLGLYQDTAAAAAEASARAGEAAAIIRAPSHVLTAARAAASPGRDASASLPRQPGPAVASQPREHAGAVQNALHELGVTSPGLLQRAADIDRASEQLIIEAAGNAAVARHRPAPRHRTDQPAAQRSSTVATPPATRAQPPRTTPYPATSTNLRGLLHQHAASQAVQFRELRRRQAARSRLSAAAMSRRRRVRREHGREAPQAALSPAPNRLMMTRRHAGQRLTLALPGRPARLVVKLPRAGQPSRQSGPIPRRTPKSAARQAPGVPAYPLRTGATRFSPTPSAVAARPGPGPRPIPGHLGRTPGASPASSRTHDPTDLHHLAIDRRAHDGAARGARSRSTWVGRRRPDRGGGTGRAGAPARTTASLRRDHPVR